MIRAVFLLASIIPTLAFGAPIVNLHPDFPVVSGKYQMTNEWSIVLPSEFNRRFEDGSLVIWRPGITLWIDARNNDDNQSIEERAAWANDTKSTKAYDIEEIKEKSIYRVGYRLAEESEDQRAASFNGYAIGNDGHIFISIYFDNESDAENAKQIWKSISNE